MKYITEMSESEILKLEGEDLEKMVQYKMALEGIKLLEKPSKPKYREVPEPDLELFYCDLLDSSYKFDSEAAVRTLVELIESSGVYTTSHEYSVDKDWAKPGLAKSYGNPRTIQSMKVYSVDQYDVCRSAFKDNAKLEKSYDDKLATYKKAYEEAEWIREEVNEAYREAWNNENLRQSMYQKFQQYLLLAENNVDIAMNFLKKAYHDECYDEMIEYIKERHSQEEKEEG